MNEEAYRERLRNKTHIKAYEAVNGGKSLEVDTRKVTHHGRNWHDMNSDQRRRFENTLVIDYGTPLIRYR